MSDRKKLEAKCGNCWHFAREYGIFGNDCCTIDEDDDEVVWVNAEDEPCNRWELDLCIVSDEDGDSDV